MKTSIPLIALAIAAFAIGTSEFIIVGLLPSLATSFAVSIPRAGLLVSAYALSVTFGSPIIAVTVSRLERKRALVLLMSLFTVGNVACALAPNYSLLFGARILTALCHGAFFGIGSIVAANVVPRNQRARAIALMFSGLTLANVLGVPAGTALGQAFGWRASFWAIVPVGVLAAVSLYRLVPKQPAHGSHLLHEFRAVLHTKVVLVLTMSTLASCSLFCVLTYIAPTLETITGVSPHGVTIVLFIFGVGITAGNFAGGRLSDWRQMPAIIGTLCVLLAVLILLSQAERMVIPAVTVILFWGFVQFAAGIPLQTRIVDLAHAAPNLASTLNQGAFNLGNALGASLGGLMLSSGFGYRDLPWASAAITVCAIVLALWSAKLDRQQAGFTEVIRAEIG